MKKLLMIAAVLGYITSVAQSQTVSPSILQNVGSAKNQISIRSESLLPQIVTVEALGFDGGDTISLKPLKDVSIKFSETSFRLGAKQTRLVYYEATCAQAPCWFAVFVGFSPVAMKTKSSDTEGKIQVAIHIPHICIITGKDRAQASDVAMSWDGSTMVLRNSSQKYIRATSIEAHFADGHKVVMDQSVPIYPASAVGNVRTIRFNEKPAYTVVKFPGFQLDSRKD
jgi:hypothetical protein